MSGNIVELVRQDGSLIPVRLLEIIPFIGIEYVVFLKLDTREPYVLEYVELDGQSVFRNIEEEEEFRDVFAMVRTLVNLNPDVDWVQLVNLALSRRSFKDAMSILEGSSFAITSWSAPRVRLTLAERSTLLRLISLSEPSKRTGRSPFRASVHKALDSRFDQLANCAMQGLCRLSAR